MPNQLPQLDAPIPYCSIDDVVSENSVTEGGDIEQLTRLILVASDQFCRLTRRIYHQVERIDFIYRGDDVFMSEGKLSVKLGVPHITAVTALAYRVGTPAAAWTSVDLALVDYVDDTGAAEINEYIDAYPSCCYTTAPVWAKVSYTAGYDEFSGANGFPLDLQEIIVWWTGWLWRSKDAPMDKTIDNMSGTVTIPSAMPARLKAALGRWMEGVDGPHIA